MALSANTVFEVRGAGNDTNGGGFVTGATGTDYSQQDSKNTVGNNISTTDAVANGTTTITTAGGTLTPALTGNIVYLQGGTGGLAAGWYQATYVSATSFTVDRTVGAGTGITMNIGGALASLGMAGASASVSGMIVHVRGGTTYPISSASNNVSGGCFSRAGTDVSIVGYSSSRGDMGSNRPVLTASGAISSFTIIATGTANSILANIEIDCQSKTTSRGISMQNGLVYKCKVSNATNTGIVNGSLADAAYCEVTGCSGSGAGISGFQMTYACYVHDNSLPGFQNCTRCEFCISDTNTGGSSDGFISNGASSWINCDAYNNGRDGFRLGAGQQFLSGNIAETNTGTGFNGQNNSDILWYNNAAYNNGTNFSLGTGKSAYNFNSITGTASFFTNAAGGDFSINNTASAGALLRGASFLGTFPGGVTIGYQDVGAVQHRDTSGGLKLIASRQGPLGSSGGTSAALDTTGAVLIVIHASYFASVTLTDSQSNTWTALTQHTSGSDPRSRFYYCISPSTSTSHTFTLSGASSFSAIQIAAFSDTAPPSYDTENGNSTSASVATLTTGSVTPAQNNSLIVTGVSVGGTDQSLIANSNLNGLVTPGISGGSLNSTIGFKIQTTAAAINPAWAWTFSNPCATSIAVFKSNAVTSSGGGTHSFV